MRTAQFLHVFLLFFTLVAGLFIPTVYTSALPLQHSLVLVLIPGLTLQDLPQNKNLHSLCANGAVGLMNTASTGNRKLAAAYLTMSAGAKLSYPDKLAACGLQSSENYNGIKAVEVYERYLGKPAGDNDILVPFVSAIANLNATAGSPGLLADLLTKEQIPLLFIGNQDLPGLNSRPGVLFAMNGTGTVKEGYVDLRTCRVSAYSPTHFTVNYPFFYEKTSGFLQKRTGLVILDLGDLARLDSLYEHLSPEVYHDNRKLLIQEIDAFVGALFELAENTKTDLMLITPYPGKNGQLQGNTLTPVVYSSPGGTKGLLSSPSTKRPGLITILDIAPTVLKMANINLDKGFTGAPLQVLPHPRPLVFLEAAEKSILANYLQRPPFLKGYVILQIIVVLSVILLILLHHSWLGCASPLLLALISGPLLFLILAGLPPAGFYPRAAVLLLLCAITVYLLQKRTGAINRLAFLYLLTACAVALDLLLGAPLMKSSLLGYDPISGARYYGLGNEYMGVLFGSGLMGSTLLLELLDRRCPRYRSLFLPGIIFYSLTLTFLVASPRWGTNVGGSITFLGGFILLALLLSRQKITLKMAAGSGFFALLALTLLFFYDLSRPVEAQSHIGLTARLIQENGLSALLPVIKRKVSMNMKLLHYSLWTRVFLTFLGASAFIFFRPPGLLQKIFSSYPYLKAGFITGIGGSFIALLVNDSGIVAAATSMIFIAPTLLYLIADAHQ